jgi:hypothetical protein
MQMFDSADVGIVHVVLRHSCTCCVSNAASRVGLHCADSVVHTLLNCATQQR